MGFLTKFSLQIPSIVIVKGTVAGKYLRKALILLFFDQIAFLVSCSHFRSQSSTEKLTGLPDMLRKCRLFIG